MAKYDHDDLRSNADDPIWKEAIARDSKIKEKGSDNTSNPKDIIGRSKVPLSLAPPIAVAYMAHAFSDGANKYGPYNWRQYPVEARVYVDACLRHIHAWFEGEDIALDSEVHHLGHALACLAIILDAWTNDKLIDNRPKSCLHYATIMDAITNKIKEKKQTFTMKDVEIIDRKLGDYPNGANSALNPKNDKNFLMR